MKPFFFFVFLTCSSLAFAQATATFSASVTIIEPVSILNKTSMNFASISADSEGKVVLKPDNTRLATGGIQLGGNSAVSAATFLIKGEEGLTVTVTLPQDQYELSNGNQKMALHSFTANLPQNFPLSGESVSLRIGATIETTGPRSPGIYRSIRPMRVMVNYN